MLAKSILGASEWLGRIFQMTLNQEVMFLSWDFPGGPVVKTLPSNAGVQAWSLAGRDRPQAAGRGFLILFIKNKDIIPLV